MKKTILINILILFAVMTTLVFSLAVSLDFYRFLKSKNFISSNVDERSKLPNYKNLNWAKLHFKEFSSMKSSYYDGIGWRRDDFKGETINIVKGYRLNNPEEKFNLKKDIWIFGGSTVWGTGVRDHETIPAYLEKLTKLSTLNLGESGYTSSQELNLYIKNVILHKPKIVFFYDGFNDVFYKCRKENNYFSGARENFIQKKIRKEHYVDSYTSEFFNPVKKIVSKIINKKKNINLFFDCDKNLEKSKKIAKIFVNNWIIANNISKENNIKFIPILQPVAYFTESLTDHIDLDDQVKVQFETVYPLIIEEIKEKKLSFVDLTKSLNDKKYYYIDSTHVSPIGNKNIAIDIVKKMQ